MVKHRQITNTHTSHEMVKYSPPSSQHPLDNFKSKMSGWYNNVASTFSSVGSGLKQKWDMVGNVVKPYGEYIQKGASMLSNGLNYMSKSDGFGFLGGVADGVSYLGDGVGKLTDLHNKGSEVINGANNRIEHYTKEGNKALKLLNS